MFILANIESLWYNLIKHTTMATPESLPAAPPAAPVLSLSAETGHMAETAIGSIENNIAALGPVAIGIGIGIFLFKRGIEAILFQKNPLRPLFKSK